MARLWPFSSFRPAPAEARLARRIAWRRARPGGGALASRVRLGRGVFLDFDPDLGALGRYASPPGCVVEIELETAGSGAWAALHVALGPCELPEGAMLCIAARTAAPSPVMIRPCLRSGTGDGFEDCFFGKHLLAGPGTRGHADTLRAGEQYPLPARARWRELVFFMPPAPVRWRLDDLRVTIV